MARSDIAPDHSVFFCLASVLHALSFWQETGGLSFANCYQLALAADLGFTEVHSFDKAMGRYPDVTRVAP